MRVALYLRRSTDDSRQPESLTTQEERLRAFATKRGDTIVAVFSDSASGVTTKGRRGFARLMACVANGPTFDAVLVRDVTRWGRFENVDESAYWEFFCVMHGVPVVYAEEQFGDAPRPYDALLKVIRRMYAAESSREKGRLIQAAKARLVAKGFRVGTAPYGMRAVEFTNDGTAPRDAGSGRPEHVSRGHFKLESSDDKRSAVVRRIFRWFVKEGVAAREIARRLNAARIPSPRGKKWSVDTVIPLLKNPAYAGISEARFATSQNFSESTVVTYADAWPAIVPAAWSQAARERFARRARRGDVVEEARGALRAWQWSGPIDEIAATCRARGSAFVGAVSRDFVDEANARALAPLQAFLARTYGAKETGAEVTLSGTFHLRQLYSLPRIAQGRASWEFPFPKSRDADGYLLVGLSPPPDMRIVEMFFVVARSMKRFGRTLRPRLQPDGKIQRKNSVTFDTLRTRIDWFLYATARAEEMFMAAVGKASMISTPAIARELGWPEFAAYRVYSRLRTRGVSVPALAWCTGNRIKFRCEGCGSEEWRSIRSVMSMSVHLCKPCQARTRDLASSTRVACVQCGTARLLSRSSAPPTERRPNDKCRSCAGKSNVVAAKQVSVRVKQLKRRAYELLRCAVIEAWGGRNGGAMPIGDRKGCAPSRIAFPVSGTRKKAYARLVISRTDSAARLVGGNAVLLRSVARTIARKATILSTNTAGRPFIFDVDGFL